MVKDHNENLITEAESIIQKFQMYFENILNIDYNNIEENEHVVYYSAQLLLKEPLRKGIKDNIF